mmetsp:Transcript_48486/g.105137  ORF Transcript_48486/g.105137 Transcript_48486/m.105137 type:complete len:428 (-) Transcript_48486:21-1304(-)
MSLPSGATTVTFGYDRRVFVGQEDGSVQVLAIAPDGTIGVDYVLLAHSCRVSALSYVGDWVYPDVTPDEQDPTVPVDDGFVQGVLLTASLDRVMRVYDIDKRVIVQSVILNSPIHSLHALSQSRVIVGADFGHMVLLDLSTRGDATVLANLYDAHDGDVLGAVWTSGLQLYSVGKDGNVHRWEAATGPVGTPGTRTSQALSSRDSSASLGENTPTVEGVDGEDVTSPPPEGDSAAAQQTPQQTDEIAPEADPSESAPEQDATKQPVAAKGQCKPSSVTQGVGALRLLERLSGHTTAVRCVAWCPDVGPDSDGALVTGDQDGRILVWPGSAGGAHFTLQAHARAVLQLSYAPETQLLFSCGAEGYVRIWNLPAILRGERETPPVTSAVAGSEEDGVTAAVMADSAPAAHTASDEVPPTEDEPAVAIIN